MFNCFVDSASTVNKTYSKSGLAHVVARFLVGKLAKEVGKEVKGMATDFALSSLLSLIP